MQNSSAACRLDDNTCTRPVPTPDFDNRAVAGCDVGPDRVAWSRLLDFLGKGDHRDGVVYERAHERLVRFFLSKGSTHPEEMADATIDRLARKLGREQVADVRSPVGYLLGVARRVWLESQKLETISNHRLLQYAAVLAADDEDEAAREHAAALLGRCLAELRPEHRVLLLDYYRGVGRDRTARRQELMREFQLSPGLLRTRVHRLRAQLERRVHELLAAETPA
jgi:DNA-directed RNA polymerase specialized sigma24 family protein